MNLSDVFSSEDLSELYTFIDTVQKAGVYKEITIWYNFFKNTMKQIPAGFQLSPLSVEKFQEFMDTLEVILPRPQSKKTFYMKLEPNRETVLKKAYDIMMNVIIYGAILHNKTGEFAARMLAMKGAKDNATTIINDLTLSYNKARQEAITKEVLEIVSAKSVIEG